MSSSSTADNSVAQTVQAGDKVQGHVEGLMQYFDIESIPMMEITNWSKVELVGDGPQILGEVRSFQKGI